MQIKRYRNIFSTVMVSTALSLSCAPAADDTTEDADETTPTTTTATDSSATTTTTTASTTSVLDSSDVSLDSLPKSSSLVEGGADSAALALAVVGTPIKLKDMPGALDQTFFGGALADIATAGSATQDQISALQRGDAICRMAENNASIFRNLIGGTMCYMQEAPKQTNGLTVTKATSTVTQSDYSKAFAQEATAKHVQIKLVQEGQVGRVANMLIPGTDSSPDAYTVNFYMCERNDDGSFSASNREDFSVNFADGTYTSTDQYSGSEVYQGNNQTYSAIRTIAAKLKKTDAGIIFDPDTPKYITRQGTNSSSGWSDTYKQRVELTPTNHVISKMFANRTYTWNNQETQETEKLYANSIMLGSGHEIRMPEVGMKMIRDEVRGEESNNHTAGGAVEWQTDTYVNTEESELFTHIEAFEFASDSFYDTAPEAPTIPLSGLDCSSEGDLIIEWDLSSTSFTAVDAVCGGNSDSGLGALSSMCSSDAIRNAYNTAYSN